MRNERQCTYVILRGGVPLCFNLPLLVFPTFILFLLPLLFRIVQLISVVIGL